MTSNNSPSPLCEGEFVIGGIILKRWKEVMFSKKVGKAEYVVLLLYVIGVSIVSYFHEPWFDEAQAWQIARTASLYDILFTVPHYEGHPPLWHLLLAVFAKSGCPYELSLHLVNIPIITAAMALLLFRSPFPKVIRCILPFTYYYFYQYAVVSRPYCIMMLAFMLMAIYYKERNTHPWRYVFSMILLCLSSSYGMMISGMLCVVWTISTIKELVKTKKIHLFWRDTRFWSLLFILIVAVLLCLIIYPADDIYYQLQDRTFRDSWRSNLSYFLFLPLESWSGSYLSYRNEFATDAGFIILLLSGALCWEILMAFVLNSREKWAFILPYFTFGLFFSFKYGSIHHIGISAGLLVFWVWICLDQPDGIKIPDWIKAIWSKIEAPLIRRLILGVIGIVFALPVVYSGVSSYLDIERMYAARYIADFIKENHLEDNPRLMVQWCWSWDEEEIKNWDDYKFSYDFYMPSPHPSVKENLFDICGNAVVTLPYFDKNVFMNFNVTCPDELYLHHRHTNDPQKIKQIWAEKGLPDFVFDYTVIDEVYDAETLQGVQYVCIYEQRTYLIYKLTASDYISRIFIRSDLLDEYPQFTPIYPVPAHTTE